MRIIAGKDSGRKIDFPMKEGTRPTIDRIKESLFNIIQYKIRDCVCLDLFAGSGSIGFEFISRGASLVYFCDRDRENVKYLKKNINNFSYQDKANVSNMDFKKFLLSGLIKEKLDLVYIDPPYNDNMEYEALEILHEQNLLSLDSLVIIESEGALKSTDFYEMVDSRKYGKVYLSFLKEVQNDSNISR